MAWLFTAASSQYCSGLNAPNAVGVPCTISCWVYFPGTTANGPLVSIEDPNTANRYVLDFDGTNHVIATATATTAASAASTSAIPIGGWHHACAVFSSTTSRAAYLDGANKGTNATSKSVVSPSSIYVGAAQWSSGVRYFDGRLADIAIWSDALTDEEVASLANGFSPVNIRPISLVSYMPLRETPGSKVIDLINNNNIAPINTPTLSSLQPAAATRARSTFMIDMY